MVWVLGLGDEERGFGRKMWVRQKEKRTRKETGSKEQQILTRLPGHCPSKNPQIPGALPSKHAHIPGTPNILCGVTATVSAQPTPLSLSLLSRSENTMPAPALVDM